jgi:hypothetical protein
MSRTISEEIAFIKAMPKRRFPFLALTDYPISQLGDKPNQEAPWRQVKVLSYDGNKYCTVEIEGCVLEIKAGYLYSRE